MTRTWLACLLPLLPLTAAADPGAAQGGVAVIATHVVTTRLRTINTFPLKRVITAPAGWKHVTEGLAGAPAPPAFDKGQACVLIVADLSGGAKSWVDRVRPGKARKTLRVRLVRQPGKPEVLPHIKCVFLFTDAVPARVDLQHQTRLEGGMGTITTNQAGVPSDAKPEYLPALGPDLRLRVRRKGGGALPKQVKLRHEMWIPKEEQGGRRKRRIADKIQTVDFPLGGLPFPRILTHKKLGVSKHLYAAHAEGLRSVRALRVQGLPAIEKARGCRPPIRFTFVLEPVPGPGRR